MQSKKNALWIAGVTVCIAVLASPVLAANESGIRSGARKPNIILVLMDNFGWGEVGVYGGGVMRGAPTPNIDSRRSGDALNQL